MFVFEMLIPDANVLSHLKPQCHFPGVCVTECPEGPPSNDASPPTVNIEGRDKVLPHVLAESKLWKQVCVTLRCPFFQATTSPQALGYLLGFLHLSSGPYAGDIIVIV